MVPARRLEADRRWISPQHDPTDHTGSHTKQAKGGRRESVSVELCTAAVPLEAGLVGDWVDDPAAGGEPGRRSSNQIDLDEEEDNTRQRS